MVSQKINVNYSSLKESINMNLNNLDISDTQQTQNLTSYNRKLFIILYAFIFLISLLGNCLLLVILCRRKRMRTVNNFFLTNIAISNLIYTLFAPFPFIVELENVNKAWFFLTLCVRSFLF